MAKQTTAEMVAAQQSALRKVVATLIDLEDPAEKTAAFRALAAELRLVAQDLETLARVEESLFELEHGRSVESARRNLAALAALGVRP